MARASKMGADVASRDARRAATSGHLCKKCGNVISHGELVVVQTMIMDERGRSTKEKRPYHKGCYRV
jgi:hypothetical protein